MASDSVSMQEVMDLIDSKGEALSQLPLFRDWLDSDAIPAEKKLLFTPLALDFVMGFRDFNRYFVKYPNPQNALEEALNAHAAEDEAHSPLLLHDWASLGLNRFSGWTPRDLFWWMTCAENADTRKADFELLTMVYHTPNPLLRFAIIESMEAAGNVMFPRTVPIADRLEKLFPEKGTYLYYGQYHLDRESGHLQNADESLFVEASLTLEQYERAVQLVTRVFEIFEFHFTKWEQLARSIHEGRWDFRPAVQGRAIAALRPDVPVNVSAYMSLDYPAPSQLTPPGLQLATLRQQTYDALWQMPFNAWIRDPHAWNGDFRSMKRLLLLPWIVEAWAGTDFFEFDTTYDAASAPLERGINRVSALYAAEQKRRLVEWELLQLDDFTGWSLSDALRFYWLDDEVEEHRAIFAELRKIAFRYPKPLHRYWIIKCFMRFQDALIHSLGVALRNADHKEEEENFITVAGFPERMHPDLPADAEADEAIAKVEQQPVSDEDFAIIREDIIGGLAQLETRRLALSWTSIVQEKRYNKFFDAGIIPPSNRTESHLSKAVAKLSLVAEPKLQAAF